MCPCWDLGWTQVSGTMDEGVLVPNLKLFPARAFMVATSPCPI